jgi:hypothetical protein
MPSTLQLHPRLSIRATMTTLMFKELAKSCQSVSFIHGNPGSVGTHLMDHFPASTPGLLRDCETCKESKILDKHQAAGLEKTVYEHTMGVLRGLWEPREARMLLNPTLFCLISVPRWRSSSNFSSFRYGEGECSYCSCCR